MILSLYAFLVFVSLVMIVLGLARPNESAMAIIGFTFLFLLSFILMNGNLEYETGSNTTSTFAYDDTGMINESSQNVVYTYNEFNDSTSRRLGYYLAFVSVIGFFGVLWSLRVSKRSQ